MKNGQVIFYDDEDMKCFNVHIANISIDNCLCDENRKIHISAIPYEKIDVDISGQPIELDPTTMKRIAKYNKEKEIALLDKKIEKKEKEYHQLKDEVTMLSQKLENMQGFIEKYFSQTEEYDPYNFAINEGDYDYYDDYDDYQN